MNKKYELSNGGFSRIRALKDFGDVKKGELGGYIQSEHNLSQEGNCWVYDQARVYGDASIEDDAKIRNTAWINEKAIIKNSAMVC